MAYGAGLLFTVRSNDKIGAQGVDSLHVEPSLGWPGYRPDFSRVQLKRKPGLRPVAFFDVSIFCSKGAQHHRKVRPIRAFKSGR